jgi:hypothetical protein
MCEDYEDWTPEEERWGGDGEEDFLTESGSKEDEEKRHV